MQTTRIWNKVVSMLMLIAMLTTLLIQPVFAAGDTITVWPSGSGGGITGGSSTGKGVWNDNYQGFRITILDYTGEPAFTFAGKDHLDLLYSYPKTMDLYGTYNKTSYRRGIAGSYAELSKSSYIITFDGLEKLYKDGKLSAVAKGDGPTALSNLLNLHKPLLKNGSTWEGFGKTIKNQLYGPSSEDIADNAALWAIMNLRLNGKWLWQPKSGAFLAGNNYTAQEVTNMNNGIDGFEPSSLMASRKLIISIEPIVWNQLRLSSTQWSKYSVYGTQTTIGNIMNELIAQGTDFANAAGGGVNGGYDYSLFGHAGRKAMTLASDVSFEYKKDKTGSLVKEHWIMKAPINPNIANVSNELVNIRTEGWSIQMYGLKNDGDQTHTYDSHNYPITDPGPHGDNPNYKEHPAPDPKTDPCTSDKINSLLDKLHYRIVKVYDQEVLYASIDENGELTLTKGTEHVSTHVREQTLPKIEVQDEMPEYRMVEWKYTYDQYVPVTEGGTESTKWEDEPIAGRTVENQGFMPEIVDITNPNDANAETTLYVHLLKQIPDFDTRTWDEPNYPDGTPAEAPEPPDPGKIPIVTDEDDTPIHIEDLLPADIQIVKVYRTHNLTDDTYTYHGTFVRKENPHAIQIDDEPMYKLKEWFTSTETEAPDTWNPTAGYPKGETGTSPKVITVKDPNKTLYVLLEKEVKSDTNVPQVSMDEDLTESQLTKISTTDSKQFGWSGYSFKATLEQAVTKHAYTLHVGCTHSCSSKNCSHSCSGHCGDRTAACTDMTRARGDDYVSVTFGMKQAWHDKHETSIYNSGAHSDFAGKSYGNGGQVADSILFEEPGLSDSAYTWTLGSDGSSEHGIAYITTISRASVGDKLNLAQYKQNAMNATSYNRVNTIFPAANKPTSKRLANGVLSESISYTIGHIAKDDTAISTCSGCGCSSHHMVASDTKIVQPDKTELKLSGSFKVFTYGGKQDKVANQAPTNIKNFAVTFTDDGRSSTNSALYTVKQTAKIEFYPYVKMSYMITKDNINFPGYTEPNASNGRTVYMLSDKKSTILPTNSIEVSWYNNAQSDGGYGLQMTSAQWSVHNRAVQGDDGWQGPNQVLPGGALYQLKTKDTETYIKTITYNTLVEKDSRTWINVTDPSKYTTDSIIKSTQDYLNEAKNVIENFRIVQWVSKDIGAETAWQNASTSVKISAGGESLSNLGLPGKASTDSKYLLVNGTDKQAVNEADLDIEREYYQTTVYKGFTDVKGDIYIAALTVDTENKMIDQATLDKLVNLLKPVCGTNIQNSLSGLSDKMTYSIVKIGSKADKTATILNNLQSSSQYNYLYTLDLKTKFITNLINSVERNTGDDTRNATWTTDGKWYNEAFDGVYEVVQSATFKVGLGIPSLRTAVLDPNLCPAKASTSQIFTNAFKSQFCIDSKSTAALDEDDGYIGTYEGIKVYLPDLTTMYISRPFYIPNANVQDTTT